MKQRQPRAGRHPARRVALQTLFEIDFNRADPKETWERGSFRAGLARLRELGTGHVTAIMCAEAVWWRCHRRIIADYLLASGEAVFHILGPGKVEKGMMTPAARIVAEGIVYDGPSS